MPIADAGGINTWTEFDGSTRNNFIEGLTATLLMAGWSLAENVFSSVTGTYGSNPTNDQTVGAGYQTYTFVTTLTSTPNQVLIGATLGDTLANLVAAINLGAGAGTLYSAATPVNPIVQASTSGSDVTFSFRFAGPMGNSTPTTFGVMTDGGFKVTGQSPQSQAGSSAQMSTKVWLYDRGLTSGPMTFANAKFLNADETLSSGERTILATPGRTFRCIANQAQFFCYVPGTAGDVNGSVLAGGIPWIAPSSACSGDVPQQPATFSFWNAGDYASLLSSGAPCSTPRTSIAAAQGGDYSDTDLALQTYPVTGAGAQVTVKLGDAGNWWESDAAYNSNVTLGESGSNNTLFRLASIQPAWNYFINFNDSLMDAMRWHGGNGTVGRRMLVEPLVVWGDPSGAGPLFRGQLWNAWIGTDQVPMDTVQQFDDSNYYMAFTNQGKWGTLWLEIPGPQPLGLTSVSYAH
jgi:hypothetical protein